MKVKYSLILASILLVFSGCGGGSSSTPKKEVEAEVVGISENMYDVKICTDQNRDSDGCEKARVFDPDKTVALLSPPKDIGVGTTSYFDGDKFIVVSKDEKAISAYNMLIEGVLAYIQSENASWCGPCRMVNNIEDAKKLLEDEFKLDGSDKQNEALLAAYSANLDKFAGLGFELKEAHQLSVEAMVEKLLNLTQVDLSALQPCEVMGRNCVTTPEELEEILAGVINKPTDEILRISKDEAAQKAYEKRDKEDRLKPYERAFDKLKCKDNESKDIFIYGVADNFNTTNSELTNPRPALLSELSFFSSYGYVHPYDYFATMHNPNVFAETLDNLPTNLTQGMIVLGLKEYGVRFTDTPSYQDIYTIGSGLFQNSLNDNVVGMVSDLRANWGSIGNDIYFKDLSQITNPSGQSLLTRVQSGQNYLDIGIATTTNVDFIAVAACTPKEKPTGIPVPEVPDKLECKESAGENLVQIWGGNGDDFVLPIDSANPPSIVSSHPSLIAYDENIEKIGVFGDSLTLPSNSTITKAQLLVNTKAATQGSVNDKIFFGNFTANKTGLYDPNSNGIATLNGGTAHIIDGLSPIYDTSTQNQAGTLLSLLNSGVSNLDVVVKDQTIVDSVRLSMCVVENPKEGDIGIEKKLVKQYSRGSLNYGIFEISFSGSLPANETLVVEDVVPNGANITHLSASPWICTPTPTIYGGSTLSCELTGAYSPIPSIRLTMQTKGDTLRNCASITKGVDTYYNNNQENDRSCDTMTATADPIPSDPTLPKSCKEKIKIDLSQATVWSDSSGNHPTENNVFSTYPPNPQWANVIWDGSYNWFDYGTAANTDHILKSEEFCSCGGGSVKIKGLKTDNTGYIDLKNLDNSTSVRVAEQTQHSQSTMASWGYIASGIENFPYSGNGVNYQLEFGVHNYSGPSGGAVKGVLEFTGHKGRCNDNDVVDDDGEPGPIILEEERIIVYPPIPKPNDPTPGDVVVEFIGPLSKEINGSIVIENSPLPIVISIEEDKVVAIDPDEFTGPIPSNLDPTVAFGCSKGHYRVAWLDESGFHSYTSDVSCSPDWHVAF